MPEREAVSPVSDYFSVPEGFTIPQDEEIDFLVLKAENLTKSFDALGDNIEAKVAQRTANYRAELEGQNASISGHADKSDLEAVMRLTELKVSEETKRFRGGVVGLEEANITAQLSQLNEVQQRLATVLRIFPSPSALLSASALGDPRRDSYLAQVQSAGHAELETFGRLAIATNNRALASAVASKIASMDRADRPFAVHDFAERVCGNEHKRYVLAAQRAANAFQAAINRNRAVTTGKGDSVSKIVSGLRNKSTAHYQAKNKVADFVAPKKPAAKTVKGQPPEQPGGKETD